MLGISKEDLKKSLKKGILKKESIKLNEEIFELVYKELSSDDEKMYSIDEFEDAYHETILDECCHEDYEIETDEDFWPGPDGEPRSREYTYARCNHCGRIGYQDKEGGFSEWE